MAAEAVRLGAGDTIIVGWYARVERKMVAVREGDLARMETGMSTYFY